MKKLLFLCTFFAVLFGNTVSYAQNEDNITLKVGLYYDDTALESLTLEAEGGFNYGIFNDTFETQGTWEETVLNITVSKNTVIINESRNAENEIAIYPANEVLKINGSQYRGGVILRAVNSRITVINCVELEEYLYGVIGSEMPSSWNIEALKAQAVCARSFATTNINKHASSGFNLCATTNCQVYKGLSAETESTVRAIDETKSELLMYDDAVAETMFFSCSGGHTADVKNVWGSDIPYLRGVEDSYENPETTPKHSWSAKLSADDIKEALKKIEIDIGDITNVEAELDNSEHVYKLTITGTEGEHTLKNLNVCSVFASYGVQSHKYTVAPYGENTKELYAKSSKDTTPLSISYAVDSSGNTKKISLPLTVLSAGGKTEIKQGTASGYIFNGGGWGHGVGMSQYGAKGMAENGFTYEEILYHYYPGTYLKQLR